MAALARLGIPVALLAETALVVDVPDAHGDWRYLEHLPPEVQLTGTGLDDADVAIRACREQVDQYGIALVALEVTRSAPR